MSDTEQRASHAMPAKTQKPRRRLNIRRFAFVVLALAFGIYFICTVISQQVTITRKNREIQALEEKIEQAGQETEQLQAELDNLEDPAYLERIAREKLGLVRPNERVFVDANKSSSNQGN